MIPADARSLRVKRPGACTECGISVAKGAGAFWSPSMRSVYCVACVGGAELAIGQAGIAGAAATREYEHRKAKDDDAVERKWGRLTPIAAKLATPKQSTHAWARGAAGEERLAAFLERELTGEAILLHDRRLPGSRANIDHLLIGPSGVWVIDAKRYTGRVERRDVGGLLRQDVRMFVGGRDQTKLVRAMPRQVEAVRSVLAEVPAFASVPVRAALCFTDSDWGFLNLGKPFVINDVIVTYPGALRDASRKPATLDTDQIGRVAARLASTLPST